MKHERFTWATFNNSCGPSNTVYRRPSTSPCLELFTTEITEHRFRSFHRFLSRCCAAIFTSWASFQRPTKILDTIFPFLLTPLIPPFGNQGTSHSPAYPKTLLIFKRISSFSPLLFFFKILRESGNARLWLDFLSFRRFFSRLSNFLHASSSKLKFPGLNIWYLLIGQ